MKKHTDTTDIPFGRSLFPTMTSDEKAQQDSSAAAFDQIIHSENTIIRLMATQQQENAE